MKKLNVIYNHNIFDEPYKQTEVKKTESRIKEKFGDNVQIFVTHSSLESPNQFIGDSDLIIAEHTFELASEEKKELATILFGTVH